MVIKAVLADEFGTHHLILGLNREDVESLLNGDVFTLPGGMLSGMSEDCNVELLFAETDDELASHFPPRLGPFKQRSAYRPSDAEKRTH
jgi:hypothetical protein